MRKIVAVLLCLLALPVTVAAQAVSLRGQWHVELPSHPAYTAVVLIDAQHRATVDATWKDGQHPNAKSFGYVTVDLPKVEIIMTNRDKVGRIICSMKTRSTMTCHTVFPDGRISVPSVMTRVGPGPVSLMPVSR